METNTARPSLPRTNSTQLKDRKVLKANAKQRLSSNQTVLTKASTTSLRNLPPRDPKLKRLSDIRASSPTEQINKLIEEGKMREELLKKRLEMLKEHAKLAASKYQSKNSDDGSDIAGKLQEYNNEISTVRTKMDNILQLTKETQNDVQRTKDIVTNIDVSQSKFGGSFHSRFAEEEDVEMFKNGEARFELERTGAAQQSPLITVNDDEGISSSPCPYRICHHQWRYSRRR
eukprot:TRINITY_DN6091_c0_g1_i4.p1 TRINITY_DN6091_c0_g1~~TRINITY_DN6091_c0_g1_i4.p1  ORF type:complete len:231 (+),score=53.00 TRINITY_DN6091_c0_g1_i4:181-873(+)